jgi:peptide deformylase
MIDILSHANERQNKFLHKKTKRVENRDLTNPDFIICMQTMEQVCSYPGVAGVAANQLGYTYRMFALATGEGRPAFFMINPKILEVNDELKVEGEGCLSVVGFGGFLGRYTGGKVRWQDKNLKFYEDAFKGFWFRAIQHEIDHVDGILYCDKIGAQGGELFTEEEMRAKWEAEHGDLSADELLAAAESNSKSALDNLKVAE